jgi:uncharacterized protein (DUF433 family)
MSEDPLLNRITADPAVMVGKPVVRGTRLTVEYILDLLDNGVTEEAILDEYPGLSRDDNRACLLFASRDLALPVRPSSPGRARAASSISRFSPR